MAATVAYGRGPAEAGMAPDAFWHGHHDLHAHRHSDAEADAGRRCRRLIRGSHQDFGGLVLHTQCDCHIGITCNHALKRRPGSLLSAPPPSFFDHDCDLAYDRLVHRTRLAAQTASFSRKIFALWRMSTGNDLWKRTRAMLRVAGWAAPRASSSRRS